jgi:hypothetical protein
MKRIRMIRRPSPTVAVSVKTTALTVDTLAIAMQR